MHSDGPFSVVRPAGRLAGTLAAAAGCLKQLTAFTLFYAFDATVGVSRPALAHPVAAPVHTRSGR